MLDFYNIKDRFPDSSIKFQSKIRDVLDKNLGGQINNWWNENRITDEIKDTLAEIGAFGELKAINNHSPLNSLEYGLLMYELERIDSGIRSIVSVQNALTIYPIKQYGSSHCKKIYLEQLQNGDIAGCFALTEDMGGSDPSSMRTTYSKKGGNYIISGKKSWVTNAPFAKVAIVWAKEAKTKSISGFIIPTDSSGFNIYSIDDKMSLRLSPTAHVELDKVSVPLSYKLSGASGISSALSCLAQARYGISWGVLGAIESVYQESLSFSKSRSTFGTNLSSKQLIQNKLSNMVSMHTKGLLLAYQLSVLLNKGMPSAAQISLAKRDNARAALVSARNAREILAAQGITLSGNVIRHMLNLETVDTYEGTYDIHTLILGKSLTGDSAF